MNKIRAMISKLAAIGAVKRRGIGGLAAYGGKIEGSGHVIHKKDGSRTDFVMEGRPVSKN